MKRIIGSAFAFCLIASIVIANCGSDESEDGNTGEKISDETSNEGDDLPGSEKKDPPPDEEQPQISCQYGIEFLSQFEDACGGGSNSTDECARVTIGWDCCGTTLVAGVPTSIANAVQEAWSGCRSELNRCTCAKGPTRAEDGTLGPVWVKPLLRCQENRCTTTYTRSLAQGRSSRR